MKDQNREPVKSDKLGENANIRTNNAGLSTPEAEEAGDFEGSGEPDKTENIQKKNPEKEKHHIVEGKGSTGHIMYEPDYNDIGTGTTGTNARKDPNIEKAGSGEEDVWPPEGKRTSI